MGDLKLINSPFTQEQRIQSRIDSFKNDLFKSEGDIYYMNQVLDICYEYLSEMDDEDLFMAAVKIKESIFYVNYFLKY